ncbi:hypothetical protein [Paraglaciecola sp. 25GB23A]|uniref:hypothetical protein n=1 Tax=Paraglaciecola sp. 25GB23A TaxID=3156068 RepID=UPI0032AFB00F
MGLREREIEIEHNGELIKFEAVVEKSNAHTLSTLTINNHIQDQINTTPGDGVFGCRKSLSGVLSGGETIRLDILVNFFRRPLYSFFVNDELIYKQKGTWGGV